MIVINGRSLAEYGFTEGEQKFVENVYRQAQIDAYKEIWDFVIYERTTKLEPYVLPKLLGYLRQKIESIQLNQK